MKINALRHFLGLIMALLSTMGSARAQTISYTGGILLESFDSMGPAGTNAPPGWFVGYGGPSNLAAVQPNAGSVAPNQTAGWNFGTSNAADRALGTMATTTGAPTPPAATRYIEARIRNNTGRSISNITVLYIGEQWRTGSTTTDTNSLVLQFSFDGVNYLNMGAAFNFVQPTFTPLSGALNGNQPTNRAPGRGGTFTLPALLPPGGTNFLRWFDLNDSGTDPGLAVDNFSFTATLLAASNQPPAIARGPRSTCASPGLAVTFNVLAVGNAPLTYQWKKNGVDIPAATAATYSIASVAPADAGRYQVQVNNPFGSVLSANATLTVGLPLVNASFEVDAFTNFPGYVRTNFAITGWTALPEHGLNPAAGSSPFADNGLIPHGTQVAFLHENGAMSQTVNGFTVGQAYRVEFFENARNCCSATLPSLEVTIGGSPIVNAHSVPVTGAGNPYRRVVSASFIASAPRLLLSFIKNNPQGGDTAALIDNVCVVPAPPPCLSPGLSLVNAGFETDTYTNWPGYMHVNGPITDWTSGIGHGLNPVAPFGPGDSPFADNGLIPSGRQVAFMQDDGTMSQIVSGFTVGATYHVEYSENARNCCSGTLPSLEVKIGGNTIVPAHPITPVGGINPYHLVMSAPFVASTTSLELAFIKSSPQGGDTTALIDGVCIVSAPSCRSPTITAQSPSRTVVECSSATFGVTASGTPPFTYVWCADGVQIPDAVSPTYTRSAVTLADNGTVFTVKIANGCGSVTSAPTVLTVTADTIPPTLVSVLAVCASNQVTATFSEPLDAFTAADDFNYQISGGVAIQSAALSVDGQTVLLFTDLPITGASTTLTVGGVQDLCGNAIAPNSQLAFTCSTAPAITRQPMSLSVTQGGTAAFSVEATGTPPLRYQWRLNGIYIPDATNFTYAATDVDTEEGIYDVEVFNAAGSLGSDPAVLKIGVPPFIVTPPANLTPTVGSNVTFNVVVFGRGPLRYRWLFEDLPIANATNSFFTITNVQLFHAGAYAVMVSNAIGAAVSAEGRLTVISPPVITAQPAYATTTAGSNVTFTVSALGAVPMSYQWRFNDDIQFDATGASFTVTGVQQFDAGRYCVVITNLAGSVTSAVAVLTLITLAPPVVVTINEVLTHTDPPAMKFVELRGGSDAVDLGGWYLSDDRNVPKKFRVPNGTVLPTNGYVVLAESSFPSNLLLHSDGGALYLYSANSEGTVLSLQDSIGFGPAENGISFGYYLTSLGENHFVAQAALTPGATNAAPKVGPVVVSEIMYHPPDAGINDNIAEEFVELQNITAAPLPLYHSDVATNTWRLRGAVNFDFGTNTIMAAGGYLVVVSFNPATNAAALAAFRSCYGLSTNVPIVGPYHGNLANAGGSVELYQPYAPLPASGDVGPYFLVDNVEYSSNGPWPPAADGAGLSLQRIQGGQYGNDPINWVAAPPAPGKGYSDGPRPSITVQPQSQTVVGGNEAVFNVTATGAAPLIYQWRFNGQAIHGASSNSYAVKYVQPSDAGVYTVAIVNLAGSVTSGEAVLTVPLPTNVVFSGLNHAVLGNATLKEQSDRLEVANLGASGADGIAIETGGADGVTVSFAPITVDTPGNALQLIALGADGGPDETALGRTSYRNTGGTNQITAAFSGIGTNDVRIEVYDGSALAGSTTVTGGSVIGVVAPGPAGPSRLASVQRLSNPSGFKYQFQQPVWFTPNGGGPLLGDQIRVLSLNAATNNAIATLHVTGVNLSFAITGTSVGLPAGVLSFVGPAAIAWSGSGFFQAADQITGPWTNLSGQASPYLLPPSLSQQRFFRLLQVGLTDSDGDGLPDEWETHYGLNPRDPSDASRDVDGDGMSNLAEYRRSTDPANSRSANLTFFVDPNGDDHYDGLSRSIRNGHGPKRSIQSAIDAAKNGDVIQMAQGGYPGSVLVTKHLTFVPIRFVTLGQLSP